MDPQVVFKNIMIAAILLGIVAFAALVFRSGSISTIGQGNMWSGGGGNTSWAGDGDNDRDDDHYGDDDHYDDDDD